jgi:hypothetical protein
MLVCNSENQTYIQKFRSHFINNYVKTHSILTTIIFNHDIQFQTISKKEFNLALGIQLTFSIVFYSQMDGLAETANATL